MAIVPITSIPQRIALTDTCAFLSRSGPASASSNLYLALDRLPGGDVSLAAIYKSTNSGGVWFLDATSTALVSIGINGVVYTPTGIVCFSNDLVGSTISPVTHTIYAQAYTYGSGFGAQVSVTYSGTEPVLDFWGSVRSDGSIVAIWAGNSSTSALYGQIYTGTLAALFAVKTTTSTLMAAALDSSDVAHLVYLDGANALQYLTVTGSGTVSATVALGFGTTVFNDLNNGLASGGNLYMPYLTIPGSFNRATVAVGIGATSNPATAVWTSYQVWTSGLGASSIDEQVQAVVVGSDIYAVWVNSATPGVSKIWTARFNGSGFDAPVVFYDPALYHPPGAGTELPRLTLANIAGALVGSVAMLTSLGFNTYFLSNNIAGNRSRIY